MFDLRNMRLVSLFWVFATLGLVLALLVSVVHIGGLLQTATERGRLIGVVAAAKDVGNLIHEMQKERGLTAMVLAGGKEEARNRLIAQRQTTDGLYAAVYADFQEISQHGGDQRSLQKLLAYKKGLASLSDLRRSVDSGELTKGEAVSAYTSINHSGIQAVGAMAKFSQDGDISRQISTYMLFLHAKDRVGLERAQGSAALVKGEVRGALLVDFLSVVVAQDVLFGIVKNRADPSLSAALESALTSEDGKQLSMIREKIINNNQTAMAEHSAPEWFDLLTRIIGVYKSVENQMADTIEASAIAGRTQAYNQAILWITVVTLVVGAMLLLVRAMSRVVKQEVDGILRAINDLTAGDLSANMPPSRENELGEIVKGLTVFQSTITDQTAERDRAVTRDEERKFEEDAIVQRISHVVQACSEGDFSQRLPIENEASALAQVSLGINRVCDVAETGLSDIEDVLTELAHGNLSARMEGSYSGVFNDIRLAHDKTVTTLRELVADITKSAHEISTISTTMSSEMKSLADRTQTLAASSEDAAAAIEEISISAGQTAKVLDHGLALVVDLNSMSSECSGVVLSATKEMDRIESDSQQISEITQAIEDIAFQTNLLALNAAVESARAGPAGQGFAVVAQEVRSLSERCKQASGQIGDLISSSEQNVERGVSLVKQSGGSLQTMTCNIEDVRKVLDQTANAGSEQAVGVSEISRTMSMLDSASQENGDLAVRTRETTHSLVSLAEELSGLVRFFNSDNSKSQKSGQTTEADGFAA